MNDAEEREWLKTLPKNWWLERVYTALVATVLNRYSRFDNREQVIRFFEKPWNYQRVIDELIKELGE